MNSGLPVEIGYTTFEFGIFDSDREDLVIGVDYESPVMVRNSGAVEIEGEDGVLFFNSSVAQLDAGIRVYESLRGVDEEAVRDAVQEARRKMREIDAGCLEEGRRSVWRVMLDDFEVMAS